MTTTTAPTGRLAAIPATALLRFALRLDGGPTFLNGAAYLALSGVLDSALGLSATYLQLTGVLLMAYGSAVWFAGGRDALMRPAALAAATVNTLWAIQVAALLLTGIHEPTTAGTIWLIAQATLVTDFALLQAYASKRAA